MADEEKKVTIEVPAKGGEPPADDSGVPKVKQTVLTKAEKEKLAKEKEEEMVRAPRRAVAASVACACVAGSAAAAPCACFPGSSGAVCTLRACVAR